VTPLPEQSLVDRHSQIRHAPEPAFDLCDVTGIAVPDPLFETVETKLFVVNQSASILALMCIECPHETTMRVDRPLELQDACDGRE